MDANLAKFIEAAENLVNVCRAHRDTIDLYAYRDQRKTLRCKDYAVGLQDAFGYIEAAFGRLEIASEMPEVAASAQFSHITNLIRDWREIIRDAEKVTKGANYHGKFTDQVILSMMQIPLHAWKLADLVCAVKTNGLSTGENLLTNGEQHEPTNEARDVDKLRDAIQMVAFYATHPPAETELAEAELALAVIRAVQPDELQIPEYRELNEDEYATLRLLKDAQDTLWAAYPPGVETAPHELESPPAEIGDPIEAAENGELPEARYVGNGRFEIGGNAIDGVMNGKNLEALEFLIEKRTATTKEFGCFGKSASGRAASLQDWNNGVLKGYVLRPSDRKQGAKGYTTTIIDSR